MTEEKAISSLKGAMKYAEPAMNKLTVAAELLRRGLAPTEGKIDLLDDGRIDVFEGIQDIIEDALEAWSEVQGTLTTLEREGSE